MLRKEVTNTHAHINAHIQHDTFSSKFYHQNNESTISVLCVPVKAHKWQTVL